jgi:riboflavin biosynthesis pyrimidine reductase
MAKHFWLKERLPRYWLKSMRRGTVDFILMEETIQQFLKEDLIDEMIITTFPLLLGGGYSFGNLHEALTFDLTSSRTCLGSLVQSHFIRKR